MKIPIFSIATDYSLSTQGLKPIREVIARELVEDTGIDDEAWLEADSGFAEHIVHLLDTYWGGLEGYLFGNQYDWKGIGLNRQVPQRCKDILRG